MNIIAAKGYLTGSRDLSCDCGNKDLQVSVFRGINDFLTFSCLKCNDARSYSLEELLEQGQEDDEGASE